MPDPSAQHHRFEATYYRTALLLGLVQGEEVLHWAERIIEKEATPPHQLLELASIPSTDLSALRYGLWSLTMDPEPPEVLDAVFGLLHADLIGGRRVTEDTVAILRQMRSMMRLPPLVYSDLNEALVSHGLSRTSGGTIGAWLERFAQAHQRSLGWRPNRPD